MSLDQAGTPNQRIEVVDVDEKGDENPDILVSITGENIPIPDVGDEFSTASVELDIEEITDFDLMDQERIPMFVGVVKSRRFFYPDIQIEADGEKRESTGLTVTLYVEVDEDLKEAMED